MCLPVRLLSLILACCVAIAVQAESDDGIVLPLLLVTAKKVTESHQSLLRMTSLSDLRRAAESQEFEVVVNERAIWLIPEAFSGGEIKREFAMLCDSLRELIEQNGSQLNKSMLSPEQRRAFDRQLALLARSSPSARWPVMRSGNLEFGFDVLHAIVLTNGKRTITLRATENLYNVGKSKKNKLELRTGYSKGAESELRNILTKIQLPSVGLLNEIHFSFSLTRLKPSYSARLIRELMEYLEEQLNEVDAVARDAEYSLIDLLVQQGTGFHDVISKGTPFHDVDSKLKAMFDNALNINPSRYGLENDAEIAKFLASATVNAYGRDLQILIPVEAPDGSALTTSYPFGSLLRH